MPRHGEDRALRTVRYTLQGASLCRSGSPLPASTERISSTHKEIKNIGNEVADWKLPKHFPELVMK